MGCPATPLVTGAAYAFAAVWDSATPMMMTMREMMMVMRVAVAVLRVAVFVGLVVQHVVLPVVVGTWVRGYSSVAAELLVAERSVICELCLSGIFCQI